MDLYGVLGVARTASAAEVERAYRRLARRYHPGVNPGDRVSAEMYRQIQHAYDVLGDAGRRREYDGGGRLAPEPAPAAATVRLEGFDFTAVAEGSRAATFSELFADVFQDAAREAVAPSRGADLELPLRVSFEEAARGGAVPLSVTRQERCAACAGHGQVRRPPAPCRECGGTGVRRWARGHLVFTKPCDGCAGQGRMLWDQCRACHGLGTVPRTEVVTIAVPAGLESGARIAVPGRGHAGARGGPTGDLYVTVDVADHPVFRRAGRDLHVTVPVAVHEAALGARVEVPTLDGVARLHIPPGTPGGRRLRLRGQGIGTADGDRGDLVVDVQIVLPPDLDEDSKALLEEFGRRNDVDVRRHLFSRP
ncbi:MAG: J domain-containing protein [Acidobacteria bacterium]|nr:J domain-containing protein [Acidobacteriota bacterium]